MRKEINRITKKSEKKRDNSASRNFAFGDKNNAANLTSDQLLISIAEAAKMSEYKKGYLVIQARSGMLKAKKIDGQWFTKKEWLDEFALEAKKRKEDIRQQLSEKLGGEYGESVKYKGGYNFDSRGSIVPDSNEMIQLSDISKSSIYKKGYLVLQAREKNLKAKKIDGKWWTTDEWLDEFTSRQKEIKEKTKKQLSAKLGSIKEPAAFKEPKALAKTKMTWRSFVRQAAVVLAILLLVNLSKTGIGMAEGVKNQIVEKVIVKYNEGIESLAAGIGKINKNMGEKIRLAEVGKQKVAEIQTEIEKTKKEKEYENKFGISIEGQKNLKDSVLDSGGIVAGIESRGNQGVQGNANGRVLAETDTTLYSDNIGDVEISAYVLDANNREIPNGEYQVRFSFYDLDRTEADPYPSDTDQGARVWEETQTVTIYNGLLTTYLGRANKIPESLNFGSRAYYLGIRVGEDAELVPRKRIGAVPLARVAMNIAGQSIGNGAGNIPLSNGTLNTNLNADLLDGQHASAFQPAGSYQPSGTYDNYVSWKLQSGASDAGAQIKTKKGAIFVGANGIVTSRNLSTLTISPTYGSTDSTIAQGSTPIVVNTTGNLQGGGTGTAGGGISLTLNTIDNPVFSMVYLSTLDLGTNTISDGNLTGNWNFNDGDLSGVDSLTAKTGNFTTANITTGNITTADFGVNTIADGHMTGNWNFNAGILSNISSATVTGNFNLTGSTNLIFGGTTSLREATSPTDSGAYLVGVNDEFAASNSTNVQGVLKDFDTAIGGGGGGLWTLAGGTVYPTDATNDFAIGGTSPTLSMFGIDESLGNFFFGYDNSANPTFNFEATDSDAGVFGFNTADNFFISGANLGIGTTSTTQTLDVRGSLGAGTNGTEFVVSAAGNVTGGTFNGVTVTAGTGTITANTFTLTLNGSAALNQNLETTSAPTFVTLNTGQGANELYAMDQNVRTSDSPSFTGLTVTALGAGATNEVVTQAAGVLQTRTIDARVWGSSLTDYSGTNTNYIAKFSDADTLTQSVIYEAAGNIGIGTTATGAYKLNVNGTGNFTNISIGGTTVAIATAGSFTGQTLYWNSSSWTASSNIFNDNTNVGIGTTAPSPYKLNVAGNVNVGGTLNVTSGLAVGGNVTGGTYNGITVTAGTGTLTLNTNTLTLTGSSSLNQDLLTTSAPTFVTLNTGQGANELYAMDQNVRTSDSPSFTGLTVTALGAG
ncbi:MAG: hypothetical protein PHP25_03820, partial [Candidatus Moranbacteria bacterium]|nr:hypothetical protein [Candidatus Moranbacteria bacterium]